ncbi:MAG: leucine-rich repeat protein [Clostridia bacterium]|nr:leucine-rich repeat protein [Clostridia bacterium]
MKTKRFLSLILSVCVLITLFMMPQVSAAAPYMTGKCGDNLSWAFYLTENKLTITGSGDMYSYTAADTVWHSGASQIWKNVPPTILRHVEIGDGVTSIGDHAFGGLSYLETVTMADSVIRIGEWAFRDCTKLKSIDISKNITSISDFAFSGCKALDKINISDLSSWCKISMESYDSSPAYSSKGSLYINDTAVTALIIPNTVTGIKQEVFNGFSNIYEVTIPSSVRKIEQRAFANCSSLNTVNLSEGLETIGFCAFALCPKLTTIHIPKSVTSIDAKAFLKADNSKIHLYVYPNSAGLKYAQDNSYPYTLIQNKDFTGLSFENAAYNYDGTEKSISVNGNLPEGATVNYTNNKGTNAGTYNATATVTCKGYNDLTLNATLKINPAELSVTANNKQMKKGGTIPTLDYAKTGDLFGDDTITGELKVDTDGKTVGNFDIKQGTLTAGSNYKINFTKGVLSVVDKDAQNVEVSAISDKTYGDEDFKVSVTKDDVSSLGEFTFESSNPTVAEIDNTGKVTIKNAGETNIIVKRAGNETYADFEKSQKLVVKKVAITVTADAKSKRIGTDDPELTYTYTGTLIGTDAFTGELSRKPGEEIGTYDILQGTLALSDNYNITYNKATFEILDKTPQNIVIADIDTKTYGDTSFAITVTPDTTANLSNFTYDSSDKNVATIDESGNVTIVGAGETTISATEAGNEDYAKTTVTKKLTVNKKALEIKVDNVTITYGDAISTNITYTGFIDGENESVLTKAVEVGGYSAKPDAGEYDIVLSGAEAANYEISYVNAKLTVNKKDVTVTQLKVFDKVADTTTDATINTSSLVIDSMILGDDVTINFGNAVATFATAEVGTDIAVTITALELVGTHAENYNLTNTEITTTASIKETITASDIAAQITALIVVKDSTEITLPNVPTGYKVTVKSSDNENVVKDDGSIAPVENDTQVGLTFTVTNEADETDVADTAVINVTIPTSTKINVAVTAEANGTVTGSGEYLKNADVTVVATPDSGYKFSGWYNGESSVSTNASYTFKAVSDIALVAKFAKKTSSGGGGGGVSKYTVKFETNGGSTVKAVSVNKNALATEPAAPTKDGFNFDGWYTDKELTKAYDFSSKVTKGFTLYAKWTEIEKEPVVDEPDTTIAFADVKENDWFYENVQYVVENKLMNGVAEDKFAPNETLTRAMLVTVLYRNEGEPAVNKSIPFADVDMSAWYANAVVWAKQNGIVNGVTENEFAPDENITREQIAAIMFRYAQYKGMDAVTLEENLHFADADEISEYAVSAMNWAVGTGLMKGKSTTTINPKDNATRAEIAAILQRFIENNK